MSSVAFWRGVRDMFPLLLGVVPFGLIVGVTAAGGEIGGLVGYLTSIIIFAGAAQLVTIELIDQGAVAAVIIATALVVNSRHLMYSAALAQPFQEFSRRWRYGLPYLLTDQAFAMSIVAYQTEPDPDFRRWYFLGSALGLWLPWQLATATGVVVGAGIPESWNLGFAIPLVFLALLVPAMRDRPSIVAGVVGGGVAVLAADSPWNLGLMIGALSGLAAGVMVARGGDHP
jgi:4-azaleucine resistance transporter AzlC